MAYNRVPKKAEVITNAKWKLLKAQAEAEAEKVPLKPLPPAGKPLGKKFEYYIELWRLGLDHNDTLATQFTTANLNHVLRLIITAGCSVLYLKRISDGKVIWDKK